MFKESLYSRLQNRLEKCKFDGKLVGLEAGYLTLYCAYLLGVLDCLDGDADEYDIEGLEANEE
jgi:hypothetical protein